MEIHQCTVVILPWALLESVTKSALTADILQYVLNSLG